jgi:hypothetical protein
VRKGEERWGKMRTGDDLGQILQGTSWRERKGDRSGKEELGNRRRRKVDRFGKEGGRNRAGERSGNRLRRGKETS